MADGQVIGARLDRGVERELPGGVEQRAARGHEHVALGRGQRALDVGRPAAGHAEQRRARRLDHEDILIAGPIDASGHG